jgi:hypothetical protein
LKPVGPAPGGGFFRTIEPSHMTAEDSAWVPHENLAEYSIITLIRQM